MRVVHPFPNAPDKGDTYIYADDTRYSYYHMEDMWHVHLPNHARIIYTGDRQNMRRSDGWHGVIPLCDAKGYREYNEWADGTTMQRLYPYGTTPETADATAPTCELWRDPQGNPRDPGSPDQYPIIPWRFPPE